MTKTILVVGATGKQGRAVIDALLNSSDAQSFNILGLTRNPTSPVAQKLADKGVQIVQGDLNDVPAVFKTAKEVAGGDIWGLFVTLVRTSAELLELLITKYVAGCSRQRGHSCYRGGSRQSSCRWSHCQRRQVFRLFFGRQRW